MRLWTAAVLAPSAARETSEGCTDVRQGGPSALGGFQTLMDGSDCPLVVIDRTHAGQSLRYANASLKRLLGYEGDDLCGREWSSLFIPVGMESSPSVARSAMDMGIEVRETLRAERPGGEVLWLDAHMYPIRDSTGVVTRFIGILHDVTKERRSREELERRACHDSLTGLANRYLLWDRFERARAQARLGGASLALVILDLNGFKLVNDRFGHQAGDEVLRCVGARLAAAVRGEDTVARLGGDEFVLLLGEQPGVGDSAREVITRVAEAVARPIILRQQQLVLACAAGVSRYPEDGTDLESLLEAADVALYRDKARAPGPSRAREDGEPQLADLCA